ncbi:mitochondrial adenine nucleotide transporter ADNT1-like isoform X2 [Musa acuminata AAA Group]|uniref:mitochondrial adenine nucleotide transporter ADNT1-like isoform X2 n=1 Tax=Musa acuminata AAA Group TaxID=214697 RepID=UPI0031D26018
MELSKALSIYGSLRVFEDYLEEMVPTVHGLSPTQQSSSLAMNKHQVEFYGFTVGSLAMCAFCVIGQLLSMWTKSFDLVFSDGQQMVIGTKDAQITPVLRLGAGACAGIIAMSATYPMDMVRGRITVQTEKSPYQYRGMFNALGTVYREEGFRALYKGWLPSVIGVIPYVGLNFAVYESLKDWLVKSKPYGLVEDSELSVVTRLACGAVAGTIGQTVAYPLDVIRRRMQMVGWKDAASVVTGEGRSKAPLEYAGMIDAFRKTVHHEGFGALYKGLVPNSVKVVPSIAIAFVTYEVVKDILGVEMRISD